MTIKEFSKLCNCNTQTLRYYDGIDLLKPARVDKFTGYRYYDEEQAIIFVKIKNLQEASFSIDEIKNLLTKDENEFYQAFETKIAEQEEKLNKIKKIQKSYRNEYMQMQELIKKIREAVMQSTQAYNPTEEFGIDQENYNALISGVCNFFEKSVNDKDVKVIYSDIMSDEEKNEAFSEYESPLTNGEYSVVYECSG